MDFGALSLIPPLVVIVLAMLTRRAFEPLVAGCLVGFAMTDGLGGFFQKFVDSLQKALMAKDMVWIILVCGLYGALIELILRSGGARAFGDWALKKFVRTRRSALVMTWFLGLFLFLDDYMSALTTGATMRSITDRFKISRSMLAFLVNTTAAPVCVLVPMTTWSIYGGSLLEAQKLVGEKQGFWGFLHCIPFMFYAWAVVGLALLVALGWFPVFGKLKKQEAEAMSFEAEISSSKNDFSTSKDEKVKAFDFVLPLVALIAATVFFEIDALRGVLVGLLFSAIWFFGRGLMTYPQLFDGVFEGFKSMLFALAILTMSYVLKAVGDEMRLTEFVVENISGIVSRGFLPAVVFVALSFISYSTASSWGMYAIAIPLVAPVAATLGADVWLTMGAVFSAGAFGSHACLYSDATVLTSASCEIDNVEHSMAQFPYAILAVVLATLGFLGFGFWR